METFHEVEIVLHVDDVLAQEQREELIRDLQKHGGVRRAEFTPGREHLLRVDYDPDKLHAQDVLKLVQREHIGAELVGPI
jgi:allophanate hydrolase subunit 1